MAQRRVNEASLTATADALRAKLGTSDPITWEVDQGFKTAVESIQSGELILDPTDVKFGSEPIDPDQLYKIGYNWVAEIVRILNEMTLQNNRLLLQEITGKVGGLGYIASRTAAQLEHTNIHTAWNINISSTATVVQEG